MSRPMRRVRPSVKLMAAGNPQVLLLNGGSSSGKAAAEARLLIEDNLVSGPAAAQRWHAALTGLSVGWVGVRYPAEVAAAREAGRFDRVIGMAAAQAESVHYGISYDLVVDTSTADPPELARLIEAHFFDAAG